MTGLGTIRLASIAIAGRRENLVMPRDSYGFTVLPTNPTPLWLNAMHGFVLRLTVLRRTRRRVLASRRRHPRLVWTKHRLAGRQSTATRK